MGGGQKYRVGDGQKYRMGGGQKYRIGDGQKYRMDGDQKYRIGDDQKYRLGGWGWLNRRRRRRRRRRRSMRILKAEQHALTYRRISTANRRVLVSVINLTNLHTRKQAHVSQTGTHINQHTFLKPAHT